MKKSAIGVEQKNSDVVEKNNVMKIGMLKTNFVRIAI